ncbi:MAG: SCO family protein [Turneriella sp.]|nr:SCO family protein [Turneriella sp.]
MGCKIPPGNYGTAKKQPAKTAILAVLLFWPQLAVAIPPADDTLAKQKPPAEVNVEEKLGADLSHFRFYDEEGSEVTLRQLADARRPVILAPVYYNCPHLCTLTLNGLLQAIETNKRHQVGRDYLVVAYSFNPEEKPPLAKLKQQNYLRKLSLVNDSNLDEFRKTWRFFTADTATIAGISQAMGFRYLKVVSTVPQKQDPEYVHPAILVFLTPELKISRYLYGVEYSDVDFRMALLEAAQGKITPTLGDRLMLTCYSFDPVKRKYSLVAWRVMRLGAIAVAVVLAIFLGLLWYRERLRGQKATRSEERVGDG